MVYINKNGNNLRSLSHPASLLALASLSVVGPRMIYARGPFVYLIAGTQS